MWVAYKQEILILTSHEGHTMHRALTSYTPLLIVASLLLASPAMADGTAINEHRNHEEKST
jgi:hypothetical protein